jgi:phosphoribosylanthranilate isomerase
VRIKICGITNLEDALICEKEGTDALGFIFYSGSKRFITPHRAEEIISKLGPFLAKVGVFVNESVTNINKIVSECGLTMVQLHGEESPDQIKDIDVPVIKGFRVAKNFDYAVIKKYKDCFFLLDVFSDSEYGGSGKSFKWEDIPVTLREKIVLAGGISIENLERILAEIKPAAIDISSSVEMAPGIKDHKKIYNLFKKYNELRNDTCIGMTHP